MVGPAFKRLLWSFCTLAALGLLLDSHWPVLPVWARAPSHGVVLLVPETRAVQEPVAQAWLDAAAEEGLAVTPMNSNRFVQAVVRRENMAGVLVPDTIHRHASDVWVQALRTYTARGGKTLLSFDAALFGLQDEHYASAQSRLSDLTGFRYARYDTWREDTTALTPVMVSSQAERQLDIQPGKVDYSSAQSHPTDWEGQWGELTTYSYAHLMYPHFRTDFNPAQSSDVRVWMRSPQGDPVISSRAHGRGTVLFANLPLGYLKTRTDGYLLHRLLGYFGKQLLQLPVLSSAPEGLGGLVLNLHVDSNAAQTPMLELEQAGWFRQGPYSIHLTAGPDTYREGDRLGLDMPHNPRMQALLRRLHAQGHEVGNHGGWIHNVFGEQAHAENAARFMPWLELNQTTLSNIVGERLKSYSAPMGNHPDWVTDWLQARDLRAYYTAGDSGLGPTRSYLGGQPPARGSPWAFPISNLHRIATFEELQEAGVSELQMREFIRALMKHVSTHGLVRLFYFHPASAPYFPHGLAVLPETAERLMREGRFRWYAMDSMAEFLDRRLSVQWQLQLSDDSDMASLHARSTQSLQGMTWVFPKGAAQGLHLLSGQAQIVEDPHQWRVIAGDVHVLALGWQQREE